MHELCSRWSPRKPAERVKRPVASTDTCWETELRIRPDWGGIRYMLTRTCPDGPDLAGVA